MINYERVAEKIFSTIKGHGHDLIMFSEDGMETSDAEEARRFFVKKPNYMVTLDGESRHIKINKNSNVSLEDMESVMKQLKNLATSNMLKTEIRVFGKEITPKDFAYQAKNLKEPAMENIQEASFSRMHGFKKTSYQTLESTKIVVRHRKPIDEEVKGSRARNIQAIFIEHAGERFRFPHNNLAGARAMARHINEGGNMQDAVGQYIIESIANYNKLMEFVRYARTNKLINENSEDIIKTIRESVGVIRREIGQLQGAKTYGPMSETIQTREPNVIEEEDTAELKDMFTVRKFDEHMGDILPIVKKLMDNKQVWRNALVEASEKEIAISEKTELSETDVFEFDSPMQSMGYKVKDIASRMIGESDLQTFVSKVAGKLIEGEQISAFEKKIVGNVLGNAVIREEDNIEEDDIEEDEKCTTKDVLDLISEQFDLNMKMIEHEDIFTEGAWREPEGVHWTEANLVSPDEYDEQGRRLITKDDVAANGVIHGDDSEIKATGGGTSSSRGNGNWVEIKPMGRMVNFSKWWEFDKGELMSQVYWLKDQLPPSDPEKYEENWQRIKANLQKKYPAPEGELTEEKDGEVFKTVHCPECGDFSMDLQDQYGDDFHYVCDTCGHEKTEYLPPTKYRWDDCEDCDGTGRAQDSIFPDDECLTCDGEGSIMSLNEGEGDKCIRCRQGTMEEGETMMGAAERCNRCGYQRSLGEEARMLELAGVKLNEDGQLYNIYRYTSANEGATGTELVGKKMPLEHAMQYLENEIAEAEEPDEEWEVVVGERKQKAHYGGAVIIRQSIEFNDAVERYDGYGGYRDHSFTYTIAPTYWKPHGRVHKAV